MSDLVKRLRGGMQLYSAALEDPHKHMELLVDSAAHIEALEEVAVHVKRILDDPSWGKHKINLKAALDKLEDE